MKEMKERSGNKYRKVVRDRKDKAERKEIAWNETKRKDMKPNEEDTITSMDMGTQGTEIGMRGKRRKGIT